MNNFPNRPLILGTLTKLEVFGWQLLSRGDADGLEFARLGQNQDVLLQSAATPGFQSLNGTTKCMHLSTLKLLILSRKVS